MLDSDLAKVYGTETKRINEAVRNNLRLNISTSRDRFTIIDKKNLYHCGDSFKDIGNK